MKTILNATTMISIIDAVGAVPDPELGGVTIGELGMVLDVTVTQEGERSVAMVDLLPTFLGCPALHFIARDAERAALRMGVDEARVSFPLTSIRWTPDRISAQGIVHLNELGIAVATSFAPDPPCPRCRLHHLARRIPVGSTSCRSSAWCTSCRDVVDILRGTNR
jgi:ring-1,2-phenylacetyl-CoA epoxidase subunit PaaD